jgi:hypothetical protein
MHLYSHRHQGRLSKSAKFTICHALSSPGEVHKPFSLLNFSIRPQVEGLRRTRKTVRSKKEGEAMKAMEPEIEAQTDFAFREILRTGSSLRQIFTRERGDDYS